MSPASAVSKSTTKSTYLKKVKTCRLRSKQLRRPKKNLSSSKTEFKCFVTRKNACSDRMNSKRRR